MAVEATVWKTDWQFDRLVCIFAQSKEVIKPPSLFLPNLILHIYPLLILNFSLPSFLSSRLIFSLIFFPSRIQSLFFPLTFLYLLPFVKFPDVWELLFPLRSLPFPLPVLPPSSFWPTVPLGFGRSTLVPFCPSTSSPIKFAALRFPSRSSFSYLFFGYSDPLVLFPREFNFTSLELLPFAWLIPSLTSSYLSFSIPSCSLLSLFPLDLFCYTFASLSPFHSSAPLFFLCFVFSTDLL